MLESERTTERVGNVLTFKWTIETNAGTVKASEHFWGRVYEGRRDALIAAGIAARGDFPGDVGNPRKRVYRTIRKVDGEEVDVWVRRNSVHRFTVRIDFTEQQQARAEDRERAWDAANRAQRLIDSLPQDADDFRGRMVQLVESMMESVKETLGYAGHGYFFDRSVIERFEWATNEAAKALEDGKVKFHARRRREQILGLRGESSRADAGFKRFIAGAVDHNGDGSCQRTDDR